MQPPLFIAVLPLLLGFLLDQLLGDPPGWPHPVRWIGKLIQLLEMLLRALFPERLGGILLVVLTVGVVAGVAILLDLVEPLWLRLTLATLLIYFGLAARSLEVETQAVLNPCGQGDLETARLRLAGIVGRDTAELTAEEIHRACIETVAENASDGVVAPLFYAALLGPAGMWIYKAINTLDSMVGYRTPRYERFGWAAAKLDDAANWLPARLTYVLLSLAAGLAADLGSALRALKIGWRDGRKHPSPNAGWPEAAMAGALGVQLGGRLTYGGIASEKPHLGDPEQPLSQENARRAIGIMLLASWLMLGLAVVVRFWLCRLTAE